MNARRTHVLSLLCVASAVITVLGGAISARNSDPLSVLLQYGRFELATDSAGRMLLSVRDALTGPLHPAAIFASPVLTLRGGRSLTTRMVRAATIDSLPMDGGKLLLLSAACDGGAGEHVTATWRLHVPSGKHDLMTITVRVKNDGTQELDVDSITSAVLVTDARWFGADSAYRFWSFQGGTYPERPDWAFPLTRRFFRENFFGMNAPDYGGGMPIVDLWTRRGGIALASLAPEPEPLALPVRVLDDGRAEIRLVERIPVRIPPGREVSQQPFAVLMHHGDFFDPLRTYYGLMEERGLGKARVPASAYGAEWCAWGYQRTFTPKQILRTLPIARRLGLEWVTIDDGYQNADGDWMPDTRKFPRGSPEMAELAGAIHAQGMKARLWWVPLEAHDSAYSAVHFPDRMKEFGMSFQSALAKEHPEWFQLNADGTRTQVSWWNSYTLCPAVPAVREHYRMLLKRFIGEWGFDGCKIDGQNMNAIPPCYNPAHHHSSPLDAPRAVPTFFRELYAAAETLRPDVVFYVCACGTNFSLYNLPYVTIPVAADPLSSWQVRHRAKAYKALLGGSVPYCGDHVELTNHIWDERTERIVVRGDEDFASTVGVGGVIATKFTAPGVAQPDSTLMLDARKEDRWKHWLDLYRTERLSSGEYLNLYDIAYDKPETHVIARGDTMYYAFYADGEFSGAVQLKGLSTSRYQVMDYVGGRSMGEVDGPTCMISVAFVHALLLRAVPLHRQ